MNEWTKRATTVPDNNPYNEGMYVCQKKDGFLEAAGAISILVERGEDARMDR